MVIVLHQDATKTWYNVEENGIASWWNARSRTDGRGLYVVVGPEGGISDAEVEAFTKAGAEVCVLGSNILRASTAGPARSLLARALGRFV